MAKRVASAQALQAVYKDDEAALLTYVHAMNAALQDALREKHAAGQLYDKTREDWAQKLQARHKEVSWQEGFSYLFFIRYNAHKEHQGGPFQRRSF